MFSNRGEITSIVLLVSLSIMLFGTILGTKKVQDIRNKAAGSCSYYSTASVVKKDGSPVRSSENGNKTMSIKNDLNDRNTLDGNGTFSFGTRTFNFGAYKKPSTTATVTLENLDPTIWKVTSTFCTQKPGSSVGCELGAKGVGSTKLTMQYFHINCGVDIAYGWVVEPIMGNPATPTPTLGLIRTFPTAGIDPRLPQDRITPSVTPFLTPTPTKGIIQRAFCNVRCNPGIEESNTCASGFTCVNTCAQGESGCAPSNRGVCRAVSCPSDTTCGCGKPLIPTFVQSQPTIQPTIRPTVAPLALPCFYDSKLSVVDTSGRNVSITSLEGRQNQWSVINSSGGIVQFDSHYGSISPLKWGFDTVTPNRKIDGLVQTSAFIPVYVPNPNVNTTSLTLRMDPIYEVVQKRILKHCQQEFDQLNGVVRGCSSVNDRAQLLGSYTGIVSGGAPNEIPNVALLCNMRVDAQYVVRKKPAGTARVNVQLSAGDDLSKNIPFETEQVGPGKHLYTGQSTVTFTGNSANTTGITKTATITQPTSDISLPVGSYAVSYNFPAGVIRVREGNDGYRLNSPPNDGTQITITENNVYSYRIIYNMNTYYCKGVRNKTSCEACKGSWTDEIKNGAWPDLNGKTLCCPTQKGEIETSDFSCTNGYDSRCTPGSTYYGNCGHTDPASGKVCSQGQRAKYICQHNNADNYWSYQGCVNSPSGMALCTQPTPTLIPKPTAGPRTPGPTTPPIPTPPFPIECENSGLLARTGQKTQSDSPKVECPTAFFGGTINIVNPHGLPLDEAKIELSYTNPLDTKPILHKKNMTNLKNGINAFRVYRDNNNELIQFGKEYYVHATDLFIGKYYFRSNESIGEFDVFTPSNDIKFTLDLSNYIGAGLKSVMLLTVDPKLSSGKSVFEEYGFDARSASRMALTTLDNLQEFSGGLATYSITDTVTYSNFPPQLNTSSILENQVRQCYDNYYVNDCKCGSNFSCTSSCKSGLAGRHCEKPGELCRTCRTDLAVDYNKLFSELGVCKKVNEEVDAIVVVTFPYSGFSESASVGPNPGAANGPRVINTECKKMY